MFFRTVGAPSILSVAQYFTHLSKSVRIPKKNAVQVLTTTPMVPYRLKLQNGSVVDLESPLDFPKDARQSVESIEEPTVDCTILVPDAHTGTVMTLCSTRRGDLLVRFLFCSLVCLN